MDSRRLKIIFCFVAIYIIWGSTYLAIIYGIATIPPWLLTSTRFIIAGGIMGVLAIFQKEKPLSPLEIKTGLISGTCMVFANGLVCVVEQWIPSGIAAVVIGAMPIWMMFIGWTLFKNKKPYLLQWIGALIGLAGVAMIAFEKPSAPQTDRWATYSILILFFSSWTWAFGTLIQKRISGLQSPFKFGGLQMIFGGCLSLIVSLIFESPWNLPFNEISLESIMALFYLILFGSVIGFTAYGYLARNVESHLVSTYALVNPVIAVALGWIFKNELISGHFVLATILVLIGLTFLMWKRKPKTIVEQFSTISRATADK